MRVIAGEAKGRRLKTLPGRRIRPSKDRLKEAVFASLGPRIAGAGVIDLYAGSGALGIEALSRGAREAVFVESDPKAAEVIRVNLVETKLAAKARVVVSSAAEFLEDDEGQWDLVFMDPPYAEGLPTQELDLLRERALLARGGWAILEVDSHRLPLVPPTGFAIAKERRYGNSAVLYLELSR